MAIKGKGKTKGRQPARAPRRAPVEVKPPFFLRRRVQVTLAFVVGILVMLLAIWITNGLRKQNADEEATKQASQQRAAAEQWKTQVESSLGKVGTLSPGAPPAVFPDLATTITALQKGSVPDGAAATLRQAQADAKTAIDPLKAYKLSDQIRDTGMTEGQVNWFLNSQTRFVQSLELYSQAAAPRRARDRRSEGSADRDRRLRVRSPGQSVGDPPTRLERLSERARVGPDLRFPAPEPDGAIGRVGRGFVERRT